MKDELDQVAVPPRIITHPRELKDAVPGNPAVFTVKATGTQLLHYQWLYWKSADKDGGSKELQPCPAEWCNGTALTIPNVQKSNEGSYCCVISNCAGTETSEAARLTVGKDSISTQQ